MIRADYHFHPNFNFESRRSREQRAHDIWRAFELHELSLVLVTEHSYKSPKLSFELLAKHRPEGAKCHIVPGVELLTKEGVDMIAFSLEADYLYAQTDLLTPWKLTVEETVSHIANDPKLYGIVVHPHTPGATSIVRTCGKERSINAIRTLGFIEKHNCAFRLLRPLLEGTGAKHINKAKYQQVLDTQTAPEYLTKEAKILTVGSDAHDPVEIGDCAVIDKPYKDDYKYLFEMAITNSGELKEGNEAPLSSFITSMGTVFSEAVTKMRIK